MKQRILTSRKGAAMELAIMVMVVTLSLSIMLVTTSLLQHSRRQKTTANMERTVTLEQIGEQFCRNKAGGDWTQQYAGYYIECTTQSLTVHDAQSGALLMMVQLDADGTVVKWYKK